VPQYDRFVNTFLYHTIPLIVLGVKLILMYPVQNCRKQNRLGTGGTWRTSREKTGLYKRLGKHSQTNTLLRIVL